MVGIDGKSKWKKSIIVYKKFRIPVKIREWQIKDVYKLLLLAFSLLGISL